MATTRARPDSPRRTDPAERNARAAAAVGAIAFLPFGVWAMVAPRSFFDQLATFEPYNQHLIQDIGAFEIGLGVVLVLAVLWPRLDGLTVGLLGTGAGAVAHSISHVIGRDLGGKPSSDIPLFTVIAVVLVWAGARRLGTLRSRR